ncbi:MAG TPA: MTH1187 family thiamine-binding protein [Thermodesulfobacteriota bacterium]|nr:MTH1187 family thiamine-binding protein [Thermodesulfobacteriota bacterium]
MIIELSVIPIGAGTSLSEYVAEVMKVIESSGHKYESHSMGTNIECGWDDITPLVRKCHEALRSKGVERISTTVRISERTDKPYTMEGKMKSLGEKLKFG